MTLQVAIMAWLYWTAYFITGTKAVVAHMHLHAPGISGSWKLDVRCSSLLSAIHRTYKRSWNQCARIQLGLKISW